MQDSITAGKTPNPKQLVPVTAPNPHPYMQRKPVVSDDDAAFVVSGKQKNPVFGSQMAVGGAGLSQPHISPHGERPEGVVAEESPLLYAWQRRFESGAQVRRRLGGEYHQTKSYVTIAPEASYIEVSRARKQSSQTKTRGVRGRITQFSRESANRLRKRLASLKRIERPVFVTLTYPDVWGWSGEEIKADLDRFGKRFRRQFPDWAFVWKLETVARKSGTLEGVVMPHFHLLVYGPKNEIGFSTLRTWIGEAWSKSIQAETYDDEYTAYRQWLRPEMGSNAEAHKEAGTRCEHIRAFGGVMYYCSKYFTKHEDGVEGLGRCWGIVGRMVLLQMKGYAITAVVTEKEAIRILRILRRLRDQDDLRYTMHHICDASQWWDWMQQLLDDPL